MVNYQVYIEINGRHVLVGDISGKTADTAGFKYDKSYKASEGRKPISISLPFNEKRFTAKKTKNFFEGLLPEGFTRRSVASYLHVDAEDYLSILVGLGQECLGAIRIGSPDEEKIGYGYEKVTTPQIEALAAEGATTSAELVTKAHLSLAGASGKVGLYLDKKTNQWYLPIGLAASTHIVKQSHVRLRNLVANEQLCMLTAGKLGLETPHSFIVNTNKAAEEEVLFATERYDRYMDEESRMVDGLPLPYRLHQEDFSQALGIAPLSKYEKAGEDYMAKAFKLLRDYSSNPIADQLKLWDKVVYDYLIGNTDNHIKNHALIYSKDMKTIRLSPAYDIVSTAIYETCSKDMGMSVGGILPLAEINREAWIRQAKHMRLGAKMAMKRFDDMAAQFEKALEESAKELTEAGFPQSEHIRQQILSCGGYRQL